MIERSPVFHIPCGGGETVHFMGQVERFLQSDAACSIFLNEMMPGMGVPMHIHHEMDEACFVVSGQVRIVAGDTTIDALPGDFVSCARGIPHGFVGIGTEPVQLLWVTTPGGYDEFFDAMIKIPLGPDGPDLAAIAEEAARFKTELVGPPPQ